jgi:hypothetical protein
MDKNVYNMEIIYEEGNAENPGIRAKINIITEIVTFFFRKRHFIDKMTSLQSISRVQSGATENLTKPENSEIH